MKKRSAFGWLELILGALFIILGVYTLANPNAALSGFVVFYGIVAIIAGIVNIVFYVKLERRTGYGPVTSLVAGIFDILIGVLLLFNVGAGTMAISILFPFWIIVRCVVQLSNLGLTRLVGGKAQFYISLVLNILGIILGFMLLFNPFASAVTFSYIIAIYLLALGIGYVIAAFSRLGEKNNP